MVVGVVRAVTGGRDTCKPNIQENKNKLGGGTDVEETYKLIRAARARQGNPWNPHARQQNAAQNPFFLPMPCSSCSPTRSICSRSYTPIALVCPFIPSCLVPAVVVPSRLAVPFFPWPWPYINDSELFGCCCSAPDPFPAGAPFGGIGDCLP